MKSIRNPDTQVSVAIENYIEDAETNSKTSYSVVKKRKRYPQLFKKKVLDVYDVTKIKEIHPQHIEEYYKLRSKDGIADITIRNEIMTLRGLMTYYDHREFLESFDIGELELDLRTQIQKTDEVPSISKEEYKKLLDGAKCLRDEVLFRIAWETGCRRKEIQNINISDINWDKNKITIQEAKKDGTRGVYFDFTTKQKLKQYIEVERHKYQNSTKLDALFLSIHGNRLTGNHINRKIANTSEEVGIQEEIGENAEGNIMRRVTAHSMRHSYALTRLHNGMSLKLIADSMGDSVETVSETYLETSEEDIKQANEEYRPKIY